LNTKEKVMDQDVNVYNLLTETDYKFPTHLPDGHYSVKK